MTEVRLFRDIDLDSKAAEIKPDRITFKQVFPTGINYLPIHFGAEYPVLPGQDKDEVMKVAVEQIRKWNLEYNPGMAVAMEMNVNDASYVYGKRSTSPPPSTGSSIQKTIDSIYKCDFYKWVVGRESDLCLETYEGLAKTYPEIQAAYDLKLKEFQ